MRLSRRCGHVGAVVVHVQVDRRALRDQHAADWSAPPGGEMVARLEPLPSFTETIAWVDRAIVWVGHERARGCCEGANADEQHGDDDRRLAAAR